MVLSVCVFRESHHDRLLYVLHLLLLPSVHSLFIARGNLNYQLFFPMRRNSHDTYMVLFLFPFWWPWYYCSLFNVGKRKGFWFILCPLAECAIVWIENPLTPQRGVVQLYIFRYSRWDKCKMVSKKSFYITLCMARKYGTWIPPKWSITFPFWPNKQDAYVILRWQRGLETMFVDES